MKGGKNSYKMHELRSKFMLSQELEIIWIVFLTTIYLVFSSFFHIVINENSLAEQRFRKRSSQLKKIGNHNKPMGASKEDALTLSDDEGNSKARKRNPTDHFTPEDENKKPAATRP